MEGPTRSEGGLQEVPHKYRIIVAISERPPKDQLDPSEHTNQSSELRPVSVSLSASESEYDDRKQLYEKHPHYTPYVLSNVDVTNKESVAYGPCTGIAAIGTGLDGKNISLLTHHAPVVSGNDSFFEDVAHQLKTLKENSAEGTIDVIIFGGMSVTQKRLFRGPKVHVEKYKQIEAQLIHVIRDTLHIDPRIFGPNTQGHTNVVLDTEHRRLHMERTEGDAMSPDFDRPASEVLGKKNKK